MARLAEDGGVWPELIRQLNQPRRQNQPLLIFPGTVARWQRLCAARTQPGFDGDKEQEQRK
jgi:hypothetical protein